MASKKPAAKPAKKTKQKVSEKLLPRIRSAKKQAARKSKPSKAKRYAARGEKRKAWTEKNPGMVPGELGNPAHPAKATNPDDVAKVMAGEVSMLDTVEKPDENLDTGTGTYVAPKETE